MARRQVEQKIVEQSANTQYFEKLRALAEKKPHVWRAMKQREMEIRQQEEQQEMDQDRRRRQKLEEDVLGEHGNVSKTEQLRKAAFFGDFSDQSVIDEKDGPTVNAKTTVDDQIAKEDHAVKVLQRSFRRHQAKRNELKNARLEQLKKEEEVYMQSLSPAERLAQMMAQKKRSKPTGDKLARTASNQGGRITHVDMPDGQETEVSVMIYHYMNFVKS